MRRELFIHFSFWFAYFVFIAIFKNYFNIAGIVFWLGGLLGIILPDIDHVLYVYLKPQELTSQRAWYLVDKKNFWRTIQLLYETRSERKDLIFHSILFQAIFLIVLFWVMTSSGSLFGRGFALSFALHLSIDQLIDFDKTGSLENWFTNLPFRFDMSKSKNYWMISTAVTLLLGIV
jgi:hypothetical protein